MLLKSKSYLTCLSCTEQYRQSLARDSAATCDVQIFFLSATRDATIRGGSVITRVEMGGNVRMRWQLRRLRTTVASCCRKCRPQPLLQSNKILCTLSFFSIRTSSWLYNHLVPPCFFEALA